MVSWNVCLQEIKAASNELCEDITMIDGYYAYFNSAQKKGYSGVAVYSKLKPVSVETLLGLHQFDLEGRSLKLTFDDFILFNLYIPHGGRLQDKMEYKLAVYEHLLGILKPMANEAVILAGDFNIAHTSLDLYYPKQNEKNIMFTPRERQQLDVLTQMGFIDSFRTLHPNEKAYTMWPNAYGLRARDIGWRIDYIFMTKKIRPLLQDAFIEKEVLGSDHAPVGIVLNKPSINSLPAVHKRTGQGSLFK